MLKSQEVLELKHMWMKRKSEVEINIEILSYENRNSYAT
jgi:hypothetical protein